MKRIYLIAVLLLVALVACNKPKDPQPVTDLNNIQLVEFSEPDDSGAARTAAVPIPAANAVYQVFQVAGSCEPAKARLALYTGYADGLVNGAVALPDSLVKSGNGFKKLTVKDSQYGTYLKVKIDKAVPYTFLIYEPVTKKWKILSGIDANSPDFEFINYRKYFFRFNCTEAVLSPLFDSGA
ncbi:hypothetical protein [Arsenicibacter rosenii]|uniref:Lipoprotein n=1 Tax=Arsenicibacter rosenii TaxID=1750698 RepID=A0A1S2VR13_9BACT|nr:hypothetical protein [Arsenicibacter rosenii]OIN61227.1 hypothetical protein BLX24_03965 [Arsenicibacter rosenii]